MNTALSLAARSTNVNDTSVLSRPAAGPVNPFKTTGNPLKHKNLLTGFAEETIINDAIFRTQHRTFESRGYALDPSANGHIIGDLDNAQRFQGRDVVQLRPYEDESHAPKRKRQRKGDPSIVEGEGAYRGPWASFINEDQSHADEAATATEELASEEEDVNELDTSLMAPAMEKASTAYEEDVSNAETSEFHGSALFDYLGRSYMHVPLDLDIDLRKESGSERNYYPKKQIFKWKFGTKPITALRFLPNSGHLLLAASADAKIKLFSVYGQRELLRSYSGHAKSISDINFDEQGIRFLSSSYDRKIVLWDTETGKALSRYNTGKIPHVVKFHPNGREFLAGMSDNRIVQFDIRSGDMTQEYNHHLASINSKLHPTFAIVIYNTDSSQQSHSSIPTVEW